MQPASPTTESHVPPGPPAPPRNPWLGVAEAVAVLLACASAILLASAAEIYFLAPRVHDVEFDLVDDRFDQRDPDSFEALLGRLDTLAIGGTSGTLERRGRSVLRIRGLPSVEGVEPLVRQALAEAGYEPTSGLVRSGFDPKGMIAEHAELTLGLQSLLLVAFGTVFYRLRGGPPAKNGRASVPLAVGVGIVAGAAGFGCAVAVSSLQQWLGWSVEEQAWLRELMQDRETLVSLLPLVVVVVPIGEELFFRGYMFRFLLARSGAVPAYLLSAGCFSLIHLHLPGLATYFIVGLIFALACRRTSTLIAPVVGHMTYNGLALLLALLAQEL